MLYTLRFVTGECVEREIVKASKDALFDIWISLFERTDERFDLSTLAGSLAVFGGRHLGEPTGALEKIQTIIPLPRKDVVLVDAIQRTNQRHTLKIRAVQLRDHGLELSAVKHAHHRGLDDVAEMMAEGDLVAAELLGVAVKVPAAHARTEVAWGFY